MIKKLSLCLAFLLTVSGCQSTDLISNSKLNENPVIKSSKSNTIVGKVEFPNENSFKTKATQSDITSNSTVSVIYPNDYAVVSKRNSTLTGSSTNSSGDFSITFEPSLLISSGQTFILEATKRLGINGNESISLRTIIKWNGNSFESITGTGKIYINTKTTALSLLATSSTILANDTINKMNVISGVTEVADINPTITATVINYVKGLVETSLTNSQDPIASISFNNGRFYLRNKNNQVTSKLDGCVGSPSTCPTIPTLLATLPTVAPASQLPNPTVGINNKAEGCIKDGLLCTLGQFNIGESDNSSVDQYVSLASKSNGDFITVWNKVIGSESFVYGQQYNSSSQKIGQSFIINQDLINNSISANVKSLAINQNNNNFAVTYTSISNDYKIYLSRFDSNSSPLGTPLLVNTSNNSGVHSNSSIGYDNSGNLVILWGYQNFSSGFDTGIYFQKYDSNGNALGSNTLVVNKYSATQNILSEIKDPRLSVNNDGSFLVLWKEIVNGVNKLFVRKYDSNGQPSGADILIKDNISFYADFDIENDSNGNFMVVYSDGGQNLYATKYSSTSQIIVSEIQINTDTTLYKNSPKISLNNSGKFSVSWVGTDFTNENIFTRLYDSNGQDLGNEFQVNEPMISNDNIKNQSPSITLDNSGNTIIGWFNYKQDQSTFQMYDKNIFAKIYDSNGNVK